jgi:hypothetical protein
MRGDEDRWCAALFKARGLEWRQLIDTSGNKERA